MISQKVNRRNLLKKGGIFLIACAGAGLGPILAKNRKIFRKVFFTMGTIAELQVVHDNSKRANVIIDKAFKEIQRIEKLMSRFRKESDIGRANTLAHHQPVEISHETANLIQQAVQWAKTTGGVFDPAVGTLTQLWDIKNKKHPSKDRWQELANQNFFHSIRIDFSRHLPSIAFLNPDVRLDLGGIAKGYAVDRAIHVLSKMGIDQGLVNIGGDVFALGGKGSSPGWKVGIKDPNHPKKVLKVLSLTNQAVATSGNYEQYLFSDEDNAFYHHLIHPKLGRPDRSEFHSLTVVASSCRDADALSTGLFFFSEKQTARILEDHTPGFSTIRLG